MSQTMQVILKLTLRISLRDKCTQLHGLDFFVMDGLLNKFLVIWPFGRHHAVQCMKSPRTLALLGLK